MSTKKIQKAKPTKLGVKAIKKKASPNKTSDSMDAMFELAAETFRVMSAPMRLKIINCLCEEEKCGAVVGGDRYHPAQYVATFEYSLQSQNFGSSA